MDTVSKKIRSKNMAAIKSKGTKPEKAVSKILRALGIKYSLHKKSLPGIPDIYVKDKNTIIFVHGCFWHQHKGCKYAAKPKSNKKFWLSKLKNNIRRDNSNKKRLKKLGYKVITIWECEIKQPKKYKALPKKISKLLK